jgi:Transglycosylase SLT domain
VRLSTGAGYFSLTFSLYDFRMLRRVLRLSLLWVVSMRSLAPASAFADMGGGNALGENGGIAGGFFSSAPMTQAAMPLSAAMPQSLKPAGGPDLCGPAIAGASASHNLPAGLLDAIAVVESGRLNPRTGDLKPWPWTIDANGAGYAYATEQAAEQAASGFEAAGITSLDIGCLQVNLAQHPDAFQNLAQAFDPAANADYAAGFLTSLKQKLGDWAQAVAAYHSQTPALGGPYAARVYAQWQGAAPMTLAASGLPEDGPAAALLPPAALPQAGFAMSSLMPPMQVLARPNNGMTGRSLASYRASPVALASSLAPQG